MIQLLDSARLETIYEEEMRQDFPAEELKPLKRMLEMMAEGHYDVWGYLQDETLLAYACVYHDQDIALLDYFAVVARHRAKGTGTLFLKQLLGEEMPYGTMMIEIEAVSDATTAAMYQERQRRQKFYERLGYRKSLVHAYVFGVHYWVMVPSSVSKGQLVKEGMEKVYRYFVPQREKYEAHIRMTIESDA